MALTELTSEQLYQRCDPEQFSFDTTRDMHELVELVGQPRAVQALKFGIGIDREGYNVFVLGEPGTGKQALVRKFLEERAAKEKVPPDFCYVYNFKEPHKPRALRLHPGKGKELTEDMKTLVEELKNALRAALESEEYQNRKRNIVQDFQEQQQNTFQELEKKAKEKDMMFIRTPAGLVFAPVREGSVVPPDEFKKLSEEERKIVEKNVLELQEESQKIFQKVPTWEREMREKLNELNREVTGYAVGPLINGLRIKYSEMEDAVRYLNNVEKDIIENIQGFLQSEEQAQQDRQMAGHPVLPAGGQGDSGFLRRYQVNLLIDHSEHKGAPVIFEDNPTYQNLVGRVEHMAHMGALLTDFNMIRPGALHKANGGYLVMEAIKVLMQPYAWEGLKRVLKSREIKVESLGQMFSVISTVSLEPQPVPLSLKVVLLGPPMIFYLLRHHDPEFGELFKVPADFETQMERTPDNVELYSRLIGSVVRKENLRPFDRGAVARVIEHSSRMVSDKERLSIHMQRITDLLRESDYWASENGNGAVRASDVQGAIEAWAYRHDRIRERMQEQIHRGIVLIDTAGRKVGQVNGLSVIQLGEFAFGRPSRITARVRLGKGDVIDIEREVEMGGPIHSKGVLILSGFLGARYAMERPLALSASLVFEQSYSGVEGDSASSAELYALLSAISEVPIKQFLAVTGSVNQHGQVQAIGGVNEKIEGFYDTCKGSGLREDQGVLIPASNIKHLMLRKDVVEAVKNGKFHIYPIETIDQGIEILTDVPAGEPDGEGKFPEGSINGKVHARLQELAEKRFRFSKRMEALERGEA
jgi:lon-related putative ATP-dependent protease